MQNKSIKVNAVLSVIKQLLSIFFPVITVYYATRTLGKESYGMVNFTKSIVSYFTLFAGLGISTYALREGARVRNSKEKFNSFANEVFTINIYSTIVAFLGLCIFTFIANTFASTNDTMLYYIFSVSFILTTLGADWINSVYEDYAYITVRYIIFYAISLFLMFFLVKEQSDYQQYALLMVLASAGGNILNVFYIRKYAKLRIVTLSSCKEHIKPIIILFASTIASVIYINSDITLLGIIDGNESVAVYNVSSQVYTAVKHIVNAAVLVTIPRLSFYQGSGNHEKFTELVNKVNDYAFFLTIPLIVGLIEFSEQIMLFLGGNGYAEGSTSLKILSFSLLFAVVSYVLSRCILIPQKKDKVFLLATVLSALINIMLNIVLIPFLSFNGAALTTLISEMIVFYILLRKCKNSVVFNFKIIISSFIASIPIIVICELLKHTELNTIVTMIISVLFSAIAYFIISLLMHNQVAIDVFKVIRKKILK